MIPSIATAVANYGRHSRDSWDGESSVCSLAQSISTLAVIRCHTPAVTLTLSTSGVRCRVMYIEDKPVFDSYQFSERVAAQHITGAMISSTSASTELDDIGVRSSLIWLRIPVTYK